MKVSTVSLPSHRPNMRRQPLGGAVCLIVFLGAVAGCATKADVRDLRDEILELSSQQQVLLRELREAQQDQEDSISEVGQTLQDIRAESFRRMSIIEDQLLTIQELVGLSQQQVASLRDQMERDRAQRNFGPPTAFGTDAAGGEDQVREVYDAALSQYQRGTLGAARLGFRQIVDQYGSDELASEARYYLAEILQREGNLEEAIDAFNEIAQFHPTAPRVPDALYRVGLLQLELGNREEAEQFLERVVNTWPDSMAADLARDELRDL